MDSKEFSIGTFSNDVRVRVTKVYVDNWAVDSEAHLKKIQEVLAKLKNIDIPFENMYQLEKYRDFCSIFLEVPKHIIRFIYHEPPGKRD